MRRARHKYGWGPWWPDTKEAHVYRDGSKILTLMRDVKIGDMSDRWLDSDYARELLVILEIETK